MKNFLLAERYARGLARSLPDTPAMERASQGLDMLVELCEQHEGFRKMLTTPAISLTVRVAVAAEILRHSGIELDQVKRLFQEMLRRGRISLLADTAVVFSKLLDARLNQTQARVSSASPLTPEQQAKVTASLESYTGKQIHAVFAVNPKLLGGVRAEVDGVVIDGTIRSQIRRLREAILAD